VWRCDGASKMVAGVVCSKKCWLNECATLRQKSARGYFLEEEELFDENIYQLHQAQLQWAILIFAPHEIDAGISGLGHVIGLSWHCHQWPQKPQKNREERSRSTKLWVEGAAGLQTMDDRYVADTRDAYGARCIRLLAFA